MFKRIFHFTTLVTILFSLSLTMQVTTARAASVFMVTTTADTNDGVCDSNCSLREAITAANNLAGTDTITVPAGTYTLTIAGADEDINATGDLDITDSLTINGMGSSTIIQAGVTSGAGIDRVFHVLAGSIVSISNTTIANGTCSLCYGGGIFNDDGTLTVTNITFSDNAAGYGGGIFNEGTTFVSNSTFLGNSGAGNGGGIINANTMDVTNSTFSSNETPGSGGGIFNGLGNLTVTNSTFSNNSANFGDGGGIYNQATLHLKNNILANSTAGGDCYNFSGDTISTNTNNLIETNSLAGHMCGTAILASDPNLGTLTGSPAYLPLNGGSPAIDAGDDTTCAAAPVSNNSQNGVSRPSSTHCDIGSFEKAQVFADVPFDGFAWAQIESIYTAGITGGCSTNPLNYCPNNSVTRAQMAVFLLRGIHGSAYSPPAATGTVFTDVPSDAFAAAWIEQMVAEGITSGCGNGNYCPNSTVTRAQMAVFLLRAKYGSAYSPPVATGTVFTDVPSNGFAAAFIEQLVSEGITSGCGGGNYCPNNSVTRAQMAVFLQRTFNLPLP